MQAKRRMEASSSYRAPGVPRNDAFEGLLAEPSRGQVARRLRAPAPPVEDPLGAGALRLQSVDRLFDELPARALAA